MLESLIGLSLDHGVLRVTPCLPPGWQPFTVSYRFRNTLYRISVVPAENGAVGVTVDGAERPEHDIPLQDDGVAHVVEVRVAGAGAGVPARPARVVSAPAAG
jgi:cellobiose phosphorylase